MSPEEVFLDITLIYKSILKTQIQPLVTMEIFKSSRKYFYEYCRQGISCNNLTNCLTSFFSTDLSSYRCSGSKSPWEHFSNYVKDT